MNDIQQDFEDMFGYPYNFSKDDRGEYIHEDTFYLWKGWQRAYHKYHYNVVVELPARQKYEEAGCYYDEMNSWEVIDALNKAGVKYK